MKEIISKILGIKRMEVLFAFSSDGGFIFETKNTVLPKTAPKGDRFQWKLVKNNIVVVLNFDAMTETTRTFHDNIHLDISQLILVCDNQTYNIVNIKDDIIAMSELNKYI